VTHLENQGAGSAEDLPQASEGLPGQEHHGDSLRTAYEARTHQLYEGRLTLAEAVSVLTVELGERREESAALRKECAALRDERDRAVLDNRAVRERAATLDREILKLSQRMTALESQLEQSQKQNAALRNMTVVRLTALLRRIVNGLRARGG
jgi:predicted RNase H-like nuclease (RuvC/YqgF family)